MAWCGPGGDPSALRSIITGNTSARMELAIDRTRI